MNDTPIHLAFEDSTLVVTGGTPEALAALPFCKHDARTGVYRAEAHSYRALVEHLRANQIPYKDEARTYQLTPWPLRTSRDGSPFTSEGPAPTSGNVRVAHAFVSPSRCATLLTASSAIAR